MKLTLPCLAGVLLLVGCAREVGIPYKAEEGEDVPAAEAQLMSLPDSGSDPSEFRCVPYIRAAVRLQGLGRETATKALGELAREERATGGYRAIILCRMLFTKKVGGEFRRPRLGGAIFLGGTDYADWPLEPIEVVDGVPFLIVRGYCLEGRAESSERYLSSCRAECEWNGVPFVPKNGAERAKALEKLIHSAKWKVPLTEDERAFLTTQMK